MPNFMMMHTFDPQSVTAPQDGELIRPVGSASSVARPVMYPTAVNVSAERSTFNPALIYMRNPRFGWLLGPSQPQAQPRSSFALPTLISPDATPLDSTLFEEPQDATIRHYLPQYAIASRGSGGSLQREVTFAPTAAGFTLTVYLADVSSSSLAQGNTPVVLTAARYLLSANLQGQAVSWDFEGATMDGSDLVLSLTVPDAATRNQIYDAMINQSAPAQLTLRRSFNVATLVTPPASGSPPAPLYNSTLTAIDSTLPFSFNPTLEPNVFAGLSNLGSGLPSWSIQPVIWQGRPYPYYQDLNVPSQIYFLPDSFKISRQLAAPHAPSIAVSINADDPSALSFTMTFLAVPVWDPKRVSAAALSLQQTLSLAQAPTTSLFEAITTSLSLNVPPSDPTAAPSLVAQAGATIDIAAGISCSLALSLAQFRQVYGALFEQVTQLLSGVVSVTVNAEVENIPFVSSASDFAGSIFSSTTSFDPLKNQLTVVLENGIESPIHIDSLPAVLLQGGVPVTNVTQQITPAPPLDLQPIAAPPVSGVAAPAPDTVTIAMQLGAGQAVDNTCSVQFDYTSTRVAPDATAILRAIIKNQVVAPATTQVSINLLASVFAPVAPPAAAPVTAGSAPSTSSATTPSASPQIVAVQVVFEGGQTANFNSSTTAVNGLMTQQVSLSVPIEAYVLQSSDTSNYTYRVVLITATGQQIVSPSVTSNQTSFYVQTDS